MSYKHLEDIQNIYEQISEPVDKQLVSEASAILIDSMFSEGYSEDAIAQYALNANPDEIADRIAVAAENYIYIEASQLNESIDGVEYEILEENSQQVANLQELVEKAIIGRALGALGRVLKPAAKGIAASGKLAGQGIKKGAKALVSGVGNKLKGAGRALKKYGPTALKYGAIGGLGIPLAIGGAKLAKKGFDVAKKFVKGGTDAFKKPEVKPEPEVKKDPTELSFKDAIKAGEKLNASKPEKVEEPKKVEPPKPTNPSGKELPKPKEVKKGSNRERMINKNVEIHGADKIKKLRDKNAAFQATKNKNSGYTRDDFIKDFPNSNTAKKYRAKKGIKHPGLDKALGRDKAPATPVKDAKESYDAFDIVSKYLIDSKQVENMDEALYVMSEMDAKTIQGIVEHHQKDANGNTIPHND